MAIPLQLTPDQEERLQSEARRLGVSTTDLVCIAIEDLLERSEIDFKKAADYVIEKNRELYDRLS